MFATLFSRNQEIDSKQLMKIFNIMKKTTLLKLTIEDFVFADLLV